METKEFNRQFRERVKAARTDRGLTQQDVATALGIKKERYVKWETRSPMPVQFIERFSILTGTDFYYLITGHHRERNLPKTRFPLDHAS